MEADDWRLRGAQQRCHHQQHAAAGCRPLPVVSHWPTRLACSPQPALSSHSQHASLASLPPQPTPHTVPPAHTHTLWPLQVVAASTLGREDIPGLASMFKQLDHDRSGQLTAAELRVALQRKGERVSEVRGAPPCLSTSPPPRLLPLPVHGLCALCWRWFLPTGGAAERCLCPCADRTAACHWVAAVDGGPGGRASASRAPPALPRVRHLLSCFLHAQAEAHRMVQLADKDGDGQASRAGNTGAPLPCAGLARSSLWECASPVPPCRRLPCPSPHTPCTLAPTVRSARQWARRLTVKVPVTKSARQHAGMPGHDR